MRQTFGVALALSLSLFLHRPVLAQPAPAPAVSVGLAIDTSASMGAKWASVLEVGETILGVLQPHDEAFLLEFNDRPSLRQDYTDDAFLLRQGLKRLHAQGQTALYDAVREAMLKLWKGQRPQKVLFIITDGNDDYSTYSLKGSIELAKSYHIPIYAIGIGDPQAWNPWLNPLTLVSNQTDKRVVSAPLQQLTTETGGTYLLLNLADGKSKPAVLLQLHALIAKEVRK